MNITLNKELYNPDNYPRTGQHIIAQTNDNLIVVYQAYKKSIAEFAVKNQKFGGPDYSLNRMSWIKPNFFWMMYRSGWAQKAGQERILAIWMKQEFFEHILQESVLSSFNSSLYKGIDEWRNDLNDKEVRLQWDPDHDPYGKPMERRALQLGLKGHILHEFASKQIQHIEDVTPFVLEQFSHVQKKELDDLSVPFERVYKPKNITLHSKIEID
jgi:hypothetical protein